MEVVFRAGSTVVLYSLICVHYMGVLYLRESSIMQLHSFRGFKEKSHFMQNTLLICYGKLSKYTNKNKV